MNTFEIKVKKLRGSPKDPSIVFQRKTSSFIEAKEVLTEACFEYLNLYPPIITEEVQQLTIGADLDLYRIIFERH